MAGLAGLRPAATLQKSVAESKERDYSTLLCTLLISSTIIDVSVQFRTHQRSNTFLFLYQMAAANSDPSVLCWFLYIFVLCSPAPARTSPPPKQLHHLLIFPNLF